MDLLTDLRKRADARDAERRVFQTIQDDDAETLRRLVAGDLDAKALREIAALAVTMNGRRALLLELSLVLGEINDLLGVSEETAS